MEKKDHKNLIKILSKLGTEQVNQDTINIAKAGSEYGNAFIHPDYIYKNWDKEDFKVLEVIPGGLRGSQDIVMLKHCVS